VHCLQIGDDYGFVQITNNDTGLRETYNLWFNPTDATVFTRLRLNLWVSLLREAISSQVTVTLGHPTNSTIVLSVQLGQ
jgi:hypothetical protein